MTPHLGASTTEAQDRAGVQTAEQVVAALTGGVVSTAVNIPAVSAEDMEVLGPFVPLAERLGRLAMGIAPGVERLELEYFGRIAERDTRLLSLAVLQGVLQGHAEEEVNLVNAPSLAEERGIAVSERKEPHARDFTDLVRVSVLAGEERYRVVGTTLGPPPPAAPARGLGAALQPPARRGRPPRPVPLREPARACSGRVGSTLGRHGINISTATQGVQRTDDELNVVIVLTDAEVPEAVMREVLDLPGVLDGRVIRT